MYILISGLLTGLWDPADSKFPIWFFAVFALVLSSLGAGMLSNYLQPGLIAYERNHPRKAGIMWDTIRFGWLSIERERLFFEAKYGNAPAYDHELPEKIAAAVARGRQQDSRSGN